MKRVVLVWVGRETLRCEPQPPSPLIPNYATPPKPCETGRQRHAKIDSMETPHPGAEGGGEQLGPRFKCGEVLTGRHCEGVDSPEIIRADRNMSVEFVKGGVGGGGGGNMGVYQK